MSSSKNHPLPAPPGQQRPRAKSNFSFRSSHSRKSSSSSGHNKIDLHESHAEKESKRLQTKADPQMALNEAEPSMVAREKSSLAPIRAIQHRDNQGNPIADPDRSNPTRSRWERPLDTIRSFEAAIDGNYSRKSYIRTESDGQSTYNRQSSHFGGTQVTTDERSRGPNGYYGGRSQSYRPDSFADGRANGMTRPDSFYNDHSNGYHPNRARYPRTASEPHFNNGQGVYPIPGNQSSYETVATASGSGSSDPAGYQTPLSENSSMDRIAPLPPVKEPGESYGFNGFGGGPQYAAPGNGLQGQQTNVHDKARQTNGDPRQAPPQVLRKESAARVPIKLGKSNGNAGPPNDLQRPAAGEKRKSWFGKRFSRA